MVDMRGMIWYLLLQRPITIQDLCYHDHYTRFYHHYQDYNRYKDFLNDGVLTIVP